MILGISVLDDRLLLALHHGQNTQPEFKQYPLPQKSIAEKASGFLWEIAGSEAIQICQAAASLALAIPASACFMKRLEIREELAERNADYLRWLAGIQLPGALSQYHYDFIPATRSFDSALIEMIFYAVPLRILECLARSVRRDDDVRRFAVFPEQLGLVNVLAKSLGKDDIPQAGVVNCDAFGASVVYVKDSRLNHCRHFVFRDRSSEDLSSDIETYLLSRADASESLPLIITGFPGDFKTNWSPIVPAFMGIHHLEFASAWGAADRVSSEIP
jgi:hypothetical protein